PITRPRAEQQLGYRLTGPHTASFMSEGAIVHSAYSIGTRGKPSSDLVAECNKAIEWATLAISKAP
ncbi:hypothetical protein P1N98_07060, partial [Tsukamurella tyrosinosolvens]